MGLEALELKPQGQGGLEIRKFQHVTGPEFGLSRAGRFSLSACVLSSDGHADCLSQPDASWNCQGGTRHECRKASSVR